MKPIDTQNALLFFIKRDIITLEDVMSLSEDKLMNKILKQVHPYSIFYSESDDRWHTTIADPTKISGRKQVVRKSKSDLEKFLLNHYHLQLNTEKIYTFDNLWVEFMQYKEATQAKGTINEYTKAYNRFYANDPIIYEDMQKITATRLKVWLRNIIEKYKMNYKAYNKFSVVFNQMYKYCNESEYFDKNPFNSIKVNSLKLYNAPKKLSKDKAFSIQETKDINQIAFDDFANKPYCVPLAVLFCFQTGLRISEVVSLKHSDIDYETKTLKVVRFERVERDYTDDFKTLTTCRHTIVDSNTKGEYGERIVDLTDDALYILKLLKEFYKAEGLTSEWLFINKQGRIHNRAMDLRIRRYCKLAGMKNVKSTHKIRSTYVSMLRKAGMSFEKIAEQVGHKSVLTTMENYSYDVEDDATNHQITNAALNIRTRTA